MFVLDFQFNRFSDGSFVVHKLRLTNRPGRYSAWYTKDGKFVTAERVAGERTYSVYPRHRKLRDELEAVGRKLTHYDRPTVGGNPS